MHFYYYYTYYNYATIFYLYIEENWYIFNNDKNVTLGRDI